jgi:hypothetical protein
MATEKQFLDIDGLTHFWDKAKNEIDSKYEAKTTPPNNEIWYTSTDGNGVSFNPQSSCGANVVSNTYENGKGIIKFDGEINAIGSNSFESSSTLKSVSFPDSVVETKDYSFRWCSNLEHVNFGKGIKKIGYQTFWMSSKLIIEIPNTVTTIGDGALNDIGNETIIIPDSVTSLGRVAQGSQKLKTVVIGNGVTTIADNAFEYCIKLQNVTIGKSVTGIGDYAFNNCQNIKNIEIPYGVNTIGTRAFFRTTGELNIFIPETVTAIASDAFEGCSGGELILNCSYIGSFGGSFDKIVINNDNVLNIYPNSFRSSHKITTIVIPENVIKIEYNAFNSCTMLNSIYCKPTTPPTLSSDAFSSNASGRKIYVPMESVEDYKTASGWINYASDIVGCVFEDEPVLALSSDEIVDIVNTYFQLEISTSGSGSGPSGNGISEALIDESTEETPEE